MTATRDPDSPPATDDDLNDAERALLKAAATGALVDLRTGDLDADNPANAENWGNDRNVRADFLADLLTGDRPAGPGRLRFVRLRGARITSGLDLEARTLLCPLLLQDCCFDEPVRLIEAEAVSIRFPRCHLPELDASRLRTSGNAEFKGLTADGGIRLMGAHIGGLLDLSGAALANEGGSALSADGLTVEQNMFCRDGFTAHGRIRMTGARIGGQLDFSAATIASDDGWALAADSLTVGQSMHCRHMTVHGEIRLLGTRIDGQFDLSGASLANSSGPALHADGLTVGQGLFCRDGFTARGGIVLTNAKVGELIDDEASWPGILHLRGFSYGSLGSRDVSVHARLRWLQRNPGRFTPGIYDQLADAYRRAGDDDLARKVLVAKERRRRKPYNPLSWLWWVTVGYGYRTWQAFIWSAVLIVAGSLVFSGAYPAHMAALSAYPRGSSRLSTRSTCCCRPAGWARRAPGSRQRPGCWTGTGG